MFKLKKQNIVERQNAVAKLIQLPESPQSSLFRSENSQNSALHLNSFLISRSNSKNSNKNKNSSRSDSNSNSNSNSISISEDLYDPARNPISAPIGMNRLDKNDVNAEHELYENVQERGTNDFNDDAKKSTMNTPFQQTQAADVEEDEENKFESESRKRHPKTTDGLRFSKVSVPTIDSLNLPRISPLTHQLKKGVEHGKNSALHVLNHTINRHNQFNRAFHGDLSDEGTMRGTLRLTVYMPHDFSEFVQLEAPATILSGVLIAQALRQYKRENVQFKSHPKLRQPPQMYTMYVAEEDGEIDTDCPPLDSAARIGSAGTDCFALRLEGQQRVNDNSTSTASYALNSDADLCVDDIRPHVDFLEDDGAHDSTNRLGCFCFGFLEKENTAYTSKTLEFIARIWKLNAQEIKSL